MPPSPLPPEKFSEHLSQAAEVASRHRRPLTLLLVDMRHRAAIERDLGAEVTARVREALGAAVPALARRSDVVGHRGDAELGLILPETGVHEAFDCARRLAQGCSLLGVAVHDARLAMEILIGGASWRTADNALSLVRRAEQNLERLRQGGQQTVAIT